MYQESFTLLKIRLLTEPDKQRFIRYTTQCVELLGINLFAVMTELLRISPQLSQQQHQQQLDARLVYENQLLSITCGDHSYPLYRCPELIEPSRLQAIHSQMQAKSEAYDPELLRMQNERIRQDLAQAQDRAEEELKQLEQELERKRHELHESIRKAETDSLTGLYNRGAYDRLLRESIKRCHRQHEPLSLVLLDLDFFKEINDNLGHQAGDEHLKRMADNLRQFIRDDVDYACRMGGDEFALIIFADREFALRSATQVLIEMDGKVSIGIAQMQEDEDDVALVKRADDALYEAKGKGRGQVVMDLEIA